MNLPVADVRNRLLYEYDRARRDLPWRRTTDPYRIWISEVMLQQTRVETVVPYYLRWMARFPTVAALSEADLEDVLSSWAGLGYYSRARNLHRAARMVREDGAGEMPTDEPGLRRLPGVGEYTAGAVASIAYGQAVPAVDGNVRRVLSRLLDEPAPSPRRLRKVAAELVDPARPGDFNQALMELGATVCTPRSPRCTRCPVGEWCLALARGTVAHRPTRVSRGPLPHRRFGVAVVAGPGRSVLLRRRPLSGLLGGMWEFPNLRPREGESEEEASRRATSCAVTEGLDMGAVEHVFTHFRATYCAFLYRAGTGDVWEGTIENARWVRLDALDGLAVSAAQRRIGERALVALAGPARQNVPCSEFEGARFRPPS